ncbi:hypothetical protein ANN_21802 [Periplaneta americana]|uniref:Endonuclease-reverse transcriptase n=1 Tax=Periplaneta americana TaxID=6978 RepID=A0ABQ8S6W5_PERAM|nr:hypothetical protein ANN_21802 [Periplaneta americana]
MPNLESGHKKGNNTVGGRFDLVLSIEFGVAQWSERLVRRTKDRVSITLCSVFLQSSLYYCCTGRLLLRPTVGKTKECKQVTATLTAVTLLQRAVGWQLEYLLLSLLPPFQTFCCFEDKSPLSPHSTLETGPWMGGVKADQATRPDELCLSYIVARASSKPAKTYEMQKPYPARAILASGTNFTAKQHTPSSVVLPCFHYLSIPVSSTCLSSCVNLIADNGYPFSNERISVNVDHMSAVDQTADLWDGLRSQICGRSEASSTSWDIKICPYMRSVRIWEVSVRRGFTVSKFIKITGVINTVFKSSHVQKHTRLKVYKTLARPVLTYGSEAWTIRKADEQRLTTAEMRFMRRTAGCSLLEHRKNVDILQELKMDPIVNFVQQYRLQWKKHVERMDRTRWPKHILTYVPRGKRKLGRPRKRWHETVTDPEKIHKRLGKTRAFLLEASKAIGLEVNPEKTKYMIMSRGDNIVRNGNIKIGNLSFEEVEKFKYLGATVTNINDTREEIKHRINMGNACYYSVEKLLSSSLLSKNLKVRIYKTVILPVVLYGCETWTLTLREEHRLRVFENKVLIKIFGAKRDEVTGEWRKLHNTELHALYSSPDIIRNIESRRLRWAGHVARMGESRNAYRVLVGRPEGKKPIGRPRRRWEDNIKMDLREVGYDDRDWINLAQDRDQWRAYVRAAMNLRVP